MVKIKDLQKNQIIIYKSEDGRISLDVHLEDETVWLTQDQMSELFQTDRTSIGKHIKNIFDTNELDQTITSAKFAQHLPDGRIYQTFHYNLDVIISVGYRVNSIRGTQFRIYATSIDYRKDAEETDLFFKTVQNKMHFAVTGKTAAELIAERASHAKQNMGLTNFPGMHPIKRDIYIAKNYLDEKELELLNRIVDAYLSFAEIQAQSEKAMKMADWTSKLDEYLHLMGKGVLKHPGRVSAIDAETKAETEFTSYKRVQDKKFISDFDKLAIKLLEKKKKI